VVRTCCAGCYERRGGKEAERKLGVEAWCWEGKLLTGYDVLGKYAVEEGRCVVFWEGTMQTRTEATTTLEHIANNDGSQNTNNDTINRHPFAHWYMGEDISLPQ
jgi:hypothetical protein